MGMIYNAVLLGKNVSNELKNKVKLIYIKNFLEMSKQGPLDSLTLTLSKYDFYFDSCLEEITPNGICSRIVFAVFKNAIPIDCKITISDVHEKKIYFEEFVKKKDIPKEIQRNERVTTASNYRNLMKNTQEYVTKYYFGEFSDEHSENLTFFDHKLENHSNTMCSFTSPFHANEGYFLITYTVDEGNGNVVVAKHLFNKKINTDNQKLDSILKELKWLYFFIPFFFFFNILTDQMNLILLI
jgi:hypothetical protein